MEINYCKQNIGD